jgi:hypothetical protein
MVDADRHDMPLRGAVQEVRREGLLAGGRPDHGIALRSVRQPTDAVPRPIRAGRLDLHPAGGLDVADPGRLAVRVAHVPGAAVAQQGDERSARATRPPTDEPELDDPAQAGQAVRDP